MLLVTVLVAVAPVLAAWELEAAGALTSPLEAAAAGAVLALLLYRLGARVWQRRPGTGDILFSDLLLWGWVRRCVHEIRIWSALRQLDGAAGIGWDAASDLGMDERVALLVRLATSLEARGGYTNGHSKRVARYAEMIAAEMGIDQELRDRLAIAAALHDIGKVDTPVEILCKHGRLFPQEFKIVKRHPIDGEYMVSVLDDPRISAMVRHHHERLDGSGYPDKLSGEAIPLGARILAVADTFDAITSSRSYRAAKPSRVAIEILREQAGVTLDADAVDAFCRGYQSKGRFAARAAVPHFVKRLSETLVTDPASAGSRLAAIAGTTVALGGLAVPALTPAVMSARVASHSRISLTAESTPADGAATPSSR